MLRRSLALLLMLASLAPIQAGIIFGRKKEPVDPKKRVPELIVQLTKDKDASKRSAAAIELRSFDPTAHADMVPALIAALLGDTHQIVRIDAAQTLGKLRPVQQMVGEALEQALEKDQSMRVRLQARSVLVSYHWAGYKPAKKDVPPLATLSKEPPPKSLGKFLPPIRTAPVAGTKEPPLAETPKASDYKPVPATPLPPTPPVAKPLPSAPPLPTPPSSEGPELP